MANWHPIPTETFDIPVHEARRGYRSDAYFWRAKVALERADLKRSALVQVFQRKDAVLCGVDETLAILKLCTGYYRDPQHAYALFDRYIALKKTIRGLYYSARDQRLTAQKEKLDLEAELDAQWVSTAGDLRVRTLRDGSIIGPWETVMTIEGPLHEFAHLETLYLGVLARRTKIATNVRRVVEAARGKPVFYFPARFDHWAVQGGDGYAASIGGVDSVSTDAQGEWWGQRGAGTIPHSLIAACKGDTLQAAEVFAESFPDANLIALVDFHNDCVNTSLAVAEELGERLWGVRLDTSGTMVDKSVIPEMGRFAPTGVNPQLVRAVRKALDAAGHVHVRIIVSGGFDAAKIAHFEAEEVPADIYGVGSSLVVGNHDFTADVVMVEGKPCSKKGRRFQDNHRLDEIAL
ncbi:MAG: quinolinate phosphoribosyl transferase [Gammaproteobacteria bacterium]|nr:quinolinate phosphoribosyl transferase [Gammaproteobacteria bacterium]